MDREGESKFTLRGGLTLQRCSVAAIAKLHLGGGWRRQYANLGDAVEDCHGSDCVMLLRTKPALVLVDG